MAKLLKFINQSCLLLILMLSAGCAEVKPWQRGVVSKPEMGFGDKPLQRQLKEHVYFSKEAAHGDIGIGAGGCGCN